MIPDVDTIIPSGGDERLDLDDAGRNRYHLDPRSRAGTLHRGSCTNSPLTESGRDSIDSVLRELANDSITDDELCARQRRRLLDVFAPDTTGRPGVFFAPSGSDLCYLPLMLTALRFPGRRIRNVVTTSEELGSGSLAAHEGRFYATRSQLGPVPVGDAVAPDLDVESINLSARDGRGAVIDHGADLERVLTDRDDGHALVLNLVIGSKSGIENGIGIIERFREADVTWTVDLCQMRVRPDLVERLVDLGCLLFCTGSKFYEAPPFCGAMLIPPLWLDRMAAAEPKNLTGFDRLFTRADAPVEWPGIRSALPEFQNLGLRVRWEAALDEMEAFDAIPDAVSADVMTRWNDTVVDRIGSSLRLELLRDQARTNDSIVSFRARVGEGGYLDKAALAEVHRRLATCRSPEIAPFERATIGQPVSYESGSFLRLAIGSHDVRAAVTDGFDPTADLRLIGAIERIVADLS